MTEQQPTPGDGPDSGTSAASGTSGNSGNSGKSETTDPAPGPEEPARPGGTARRGRLRGLAIDTRPLALPAFRRLWLGQGVSFIGFQVTAVAVPVQVYDMTRSSFWVGALGFVNLVPLIVFGLWGGAVADHVDRRRLLFVASCVMWVATLLLLVQALLGIENLALIMAVVAIQAIGFAVSSPTRSAIIPRLFDARLVPAANTLNFTILQGGGLAGPLFAGVILARWSYGAAYALDAVLFTVALYAALRLPAIPPLADTGRAPGLRSVFDGLRFLSTQPVLMMSFVVDIIAMAIAMPRALFPEVAETRFGGEGAVGYLFAAIAIGAFLGGLSSGWIGRVHRQGIALVASIAIWGLAVAAAGLSHQLWLAVVLLAVGGAADLVSSVFRQTMLQTYAPDEMRGRLQGVFTVVVAGGPRLGDVRAGATASLAGATASWVGGGLACAVLVVVAGFAVPALLRYDTRTAQTVSVKG
ncbi:MFS transporter [Actinomadura madurae]|uniref:MFS transporter n=1 Tax=Actinomadura madurae TaxID=1993 RepID=UPI00202603DB|nr:MFS transporter [Actinomadura madurae]MCP9953247.1 MFS transporter [Actinomadura madurae]MCP9970010.1 MFS transporter [Actinomadura madurae]MCP9982470.1 MFS transporter [Actinomadura madurae]MCQ0006001.1 MFS transporter [Actinomadura madurae]MCQ0018712.1 MFS transporter [Actinomadura madurae]